MKVVVAHLNRDYDIMSESSKVLYKGCHDTWVDKAGDRIGIACRHIRELAMSKTEFVDPVLKKLMDKISIDALPAVPKFGGLVLLDPDPPNIHRACGAVPRRVGQPRTNCKQMDMSKW